jgi:stage III sporulation protein AD
MELIKLGILGIAGVFLGLFFKETKPQYSMYVSIAICLCLTGYSAVKLVRLFQNVKQIQDYLPMNSEYLSTLLKILGISYIGQFSAGICKDAGYGAIAGQIELFCKLSIMVISMPILMVLLETIGEFLM